MVAKEIVLYSSGRTRRVICLERTCSDHYGLCIGAQLLSSKLGIYLCIEQGCIFPRMIYRQTTSLAWRNQRLHLSVFR